uniref:Uncharacterized protein n=1 Tax=Xanthomonas pisi TaxID=56457 RepID=A0A2S7CQS5_9XANT|nr:hypothetical protein XpiCFBP4643_22915 [Xanthomonas pisi]
MDFHFYLDFLAHREVLPIATGIAAWNCDHLKAGSNTDQDTLSAAHLFRERDFGWRSRRSYRSDECHKKKHTDAFHFLLTPSYDLPKRRNIIFGKMLVLVHHQTL